MSDHGKLFWRIQGLGCHHDPPTYPTNAFRFLQPETDPAWSTDTQNGPQQGYTHTSDTTRSIESYSAPAWQRQQRRASLPLNIVIIGAGLGGLATAIALALSGHKVRVYEQAPVFGEVGAGIQVPPNSTRHLLAWGVGKHIEPHISEPYGINLRRWKDGTLISHTRLRPDFKQKYAAPYWVLHRAEYHSALLARALELGVSINGDHEVISYEQAGDAEQASVSFLNGTTVDADLIIGADGLKSLARSTVLRSYGYEVIEPLPTGQAAYRCTVPLSVIASNPQTSWISDAPNQNLWIGPGRHAMTYPIGGQDSPNRLFNLVLSHAEARPPEEWHTDAKKTKAEMRANFDGFEPRFTEVIRILSEHEKAKVVKWPILMAPPLETWVHKTGKMVVLGDSAHAMVPYMSQGAAMAVEDAAAIAALLSQPKTKEEVPKALHVFEQVRKGRTGGMQQASWLNGEIWHLEDGTEQEARDSAMGERWAQTHGWNANQWSDPACQRWTYGYDAVDEVLKAWDEAVKKA